MVRDELNIHHAAGDGAAWIKTACRLFMRTHGYVVVRMAQSAMPDTVQLFCAKCMAINYFYIPRLAHFIVRSVTRSTPIESRESEKIGARITSAQTKLIQSLSKTVPQENRVRSQFFHYLPFILIYGIFNLILLKAFFVRLYQQCGVRIGGPADQYVIPLSRVRMIRVFLRYLPTHGHSTHSR
jgi:hypothetical protein